DPGEGRRVRDIEDGVDRDAPRAWQLPGDDRRSRQCRARVVVVGQGREDAVEGTSPEGARRGHEPGGSPTRWPHTRWPQRGEPVGQEGRRQDAQHEETIAAPDRSRSQARQGYSVRVLTSYGEICQERR